MTRIEIRDSVLSHLLEREADDFGGDYEAALMSLFERAWGMAWEEIEKRYKHVGQAASREGAEQ